MRIAFSLFLTMICLLAGTVSAEAQEALKYPVVLIRSLDEFGEENTGAGVLLGRDADNLYFFTAEHVISASPDSISIQFYKGPKVSGLLAKSNQTLDIALLYCPIPPGYVAPPSFALAKTAEKALQSVIVLGHPLGNNWDMNFNTNVKSTEYEMDERLFTMAPIGISPGNSGGVVLNQQYELLGMVTRVDPVNAICVDVATLLKACQTWEAPINLMTGISVEKPSSSGQEDFRYQLFVQEGNTSYQTKKWGQAKVAFEQAYAIAPSEELRLKIETCRNEISLEENYNKNISEGRRANDLSSALGFYLQAQKHRDSEEVRNLIKQTKESLAKMELLSSVASVPVDQLPAKVTDGEVGNLILVRGGVFTMGCDTCEEDSYPAHPVLLDDYYMAANPLTIEQYVKYLNEVWSKERHPCWGVLSEKKGITYVYKPEAGKEKMPAILYFPKVLEYCQWLTEKSGYVFRLPTEAEWEYAAGGGHKRPVPFNGAKVRNLANPLGFVDMFKNNQEYCSDTYLANYFQYCSQQGVCANPEGPPLWGEMVVTRGGGNDFHKRSLERWTPSEGTKGEYGSFEPKFRIVRSLYPQKLSYETKLRTLFEKNMVLVKGGQFTMGDDTNGSIASRQFSHLDVCSDLPANDNPAHEVSVDDFYISKTEVTVYQWNAVMKGEMPLLRQDCELATANYHEAEEFIAKLNTLTGINYRLPTEAEWEYAARGGQSSTTTYSGTDSYEEVNSWQTRRSYCEYLSLSSTVPNKLGLYFLSSHHFEWCQDWYNVDYYRNSPLNNPVGPPIGSYKVIRGGQYSNYHSSATPVFGRELMSLEMYDWDGGTSSIDDVVGIRLVKSANNLPVSPPVFTDPFEKDWVFVKGGVHKRGFNDEDQVEIADFYILKYEVTQEQFKEVTGYLPEGNECEKCPVGNIILRDVQVFLRALSSHVQEGKTYRLPTEYELNFILEKDKTLNQIDSDQVLSKYANLKYADKATSCVLPVGSLLPGQLGIYDLMGNVSEMLGAWDRVRDFWGGSYLTKPSDMLRYHRLSVQHERYYSEPGMGFRIVMVNNE